MIDLVISQYIQKHMVQSLARTITNTAVITARDAAFVNTMVIVQEAVNLYDPDWMENTYFVSSSETAFEMCLLTKFDVELLHGQISYKQRAEIYNHNNGYPVPPKTCSTLDKDKLPQRLVITQFHFIHAVTSKYVHDELFV